MSSSSKFCSEQSDGDNEQQHSQTGISASDNSAALVTTISVESSLNDTVNISASAGCSAAVDQSLENNVTTPATEEKEAIENISHLTGDSKDNSIIDDSTCAVCLLEFIHPVQLPCSHIFCYLCLKGVTLTNGPTCPLCRGVIPQHFLQKPTLVTPPPLRSRDRTQPTKSTSAPTNTPPPTGRRASLRPRRGSHDGGAVVQPSVEVTDGEKQQQPVEDYQWFYEGRNGWWRYDARTNTDLEEAHGAGTAFLTLLLAGHNFTIDLVNMNQRRTDGFGMTRAIKRDSPLCQAKGTAGLHSSALVKAAGKRSVAQHKRKRQQ